MLAYLRLNYYLCNAMVEEVAKKEVMCLRAYNSLNEW